MSGRGYILRVTEESVVFLANLEGGTTELYRNHVLINRVSKIPHYINCSTQCHKILITVI